MRRSEVEAWLAQHGGQANYTTVDDPYDNPSTDPGEIKLHPKLVRTKVTWTAKDGQKLTVIDHNRRDQDAIDNDFVRNPNGSQQYDPDYQTVEQGTEIKTDTRSDETKRNEAELDAQRTRNKQLDGHWETDADRATRLHTEQADKERVAQQAEANRLEGERVGIAQRGEDRAGRSEDRAGRIEDRQATTAAQQATNDAARLGIEQSKYDLDRQKANAPSILGTPSPDNKQIAIFDPVTSKVTAQDNPIYDQAKQAAERKKEEISLAIQANKLTADAGAAEYDRWWKQNIQLPFTQAAEQRAQAQEQRATLQAQEQRRQFQAQQDLATQKFGQEAGQAAVTNELALQPYRVGASFGPEMSSAVNSLAQGGKMDSNASAGINFTPDAFTYQRPNLDKIAKKATAAALKHVSSYKPSDTDFAQPDYSGISLPGAAVGETAPVAGAPIDINKMIQDLIQNKAYGGPGATSP